MIADSNSFSEAMQNGLHTLYETQQSWLMQLIKQGQEQGVFSVQSSAEESAQLILALGLGSQLIARVSNNPEQIHQLKDKALHLLVSGPHDMETLKQRGLS